ncbi:MAG: hypothetical protein EAX96_09985 [Candidatus Lokiarchaeota archaeon]|nr:hypothetical protein [Candidatus Lokiarchaeota archaeon]
MKDFNRLYEETKQMSRDEIIKNGLPILISLIEKAKEIGLIKVLKEFPDITEFLRNKISIFEPDDALLMFKEYVPLIYDGVISLIEENEEIKHKIEGTEDICVAMEIDDADFAVTGKLKEARMSYQMGINNNVDLIIKMKKDAMKKLLSGELEVVQGLKSGVIKAEGNITKALGLRPIIDIISKEISIKPMNIQIE